MNEEGGERNSKRVAKLKGPGWFGCEKEVKKEREVEKQGGEAPPGIIRRRRRRTYLFGDLVWGGQEEGKGRKGGRQTPRKEGSLWKRSWSWEREKKQKEKDKEERKEKKTKKQGKKKSEIRSKRFRHFFKT